MQRLRVAAAQINLHVGDLDGNVERILAAYAEAVAAGADLVAFPEMAVTGYPPEDLLLKPGFVAAARDALEAVAAETTDAAAVVGFCEAGVGLHNAAAVCAHGSVRGVYRKRLLPNYAVFDERRWFVPGDTSGPLFEVGGLRVGVSICEDIWSSHGPLIDQSAGGAQVGVNINGSPFRVAKPADRERMLATRAADAGVPLLYCNLVGGQDELVFDGHSVAFDADGELVARAPLFDEHVLVVDLDVRGAYRQRIIDPRGRPEGPALPVVVVTAAAERRPPAPPERPIQTLPGRLDQVWSALVLGTRDYVVKNGFSDVVLGLSGGVDSSLTAAIAAEAVGPEHVHAIALPSRYSTEGSLADARALADGLGIDLRVVPIEPAHRALLEMLEPAADDPIVGLAEENLQSRVRGVVWMALSNASGWLVLTCGNKSEASVGYATLYGDTAGGFAVISDVPKTLVYELCRWRNERARRAIVPESVLTKAPSAELAPGQRDVDSLPPYDVLDPILHAYVERDLTVAEIAALGHDPAVVARVALLVDRAEHKRRQSPPGPRISSKAFGRDRRLPITNAF